MKDNQRNYYVDEQLIMEQHVLASNPYGYKKIMTIKKVLLYVKHQQEHTHVNYVMRSS